MNHMPWQCAMPSSIIFMMALMRASDRYTSLRVGRLDQSKFLALEQGGSPQADELVEIRDGFLQHHVHAARDGEDVDELWEGKDH